MAVAAKRAVMLRSLSFALLVAALSAPAQADTGAGPRLKQITPFLEAYLRLPPAERSLFRMQYCMRRNDKPAAEAVARFVVGAETRTIAADARGCWRRLPTADELRANPRLSFNLPADGENEINLWVSPNGGPQETYAVAPLNAALAQAARGARKQAGVVGFAIPRFETVYFSFDGGPPEGSAAILADGRRVALPAGRRSVTFTPGDPALAGAQRIELAAAPSIIFFGPKPRDR